MARLSITVAALLSLCSVANAFVPASFSHRQVVTSVKSATAEETFTFEGAKRNRLETVHP